MRHASLGLWMLGAAAVGCGGGAASEKPVSAAPPQEAKAPANPESPAAKADARFLQLSKDIDKLGKGELVDKAWLAQQLNEVLAIDKNHLAARYHLGVLKAASDDSKGAKEIYQELYEQHPEFAPAAENLAAFWVTEGEVTKAKGVYRQLIAKDPKNVTSRLALSRILSQEREYKEAVSLARDALQQKADAIEAFRVLAACYHALGNDPMAELIIGRGLKVNKDDPELHYVAAQILLSKKDLVGGLNRLKNVVALDPKWMKARAQLADIALSYRDFGNAAQQLEAINKEDPKNRSVRIALGVSYKGMGRFEQAEKTYLALLDDDSKDAEALWNLAVLYHRHLNRYDDAVAFYKRAKSAAPSNDEKTSEVDKLVADIEKQKADVEATRAREERERKKIAAVEAACAAVKEGKKADGAAVGNDQERVEVGWQLVMNAQASVQNGDIPGGESLFACAMAIIPDTQGAKTEACAPMRNSWTQVLYALGRLEEALANTNIALGCAPEDPDARLIQQQLTELIAQQAAANQPPPTEGTPAPAAPSAPQGKGKRRGR